MEPTLYDWQWNVDKVPYSRAYIITYIHNMPGSHEINKVVECYYRYNSMDVTCIIDYDSTV